MRWIAALLPVTLCACGAAELDSPSWAVRLTATTSSALESRVVSDRLASRDPLDAVWGAYLAGELGLTAEADDLLGLTQDGPLLSGAALDALARVGASVPDARLRELMPVEPMTAMAIALQEPAAHRDLIFEAFLLAHEKLPAVIDDPFAEGDLAEWRAYANALAFLRDRELVATLLGSLEASLDIEVVSPDAATASFGCRCGGAFGTSCHGWSGYRFDPLPPVGTWSIREASNDTCVVVLPGPTDVCLARVEGRLEESMRERALSGLPLRSWVSDIGQDAALEMVDSYGIEDEIEAEPEVEPEEDSLDDDGGEYGDPRQTNEELLAYLSAVHGETLTFDGNLSLTHVWEGEAAYRAMAVAARDGLRAAHAALARRLDDAYLLPAGFRPLPVPVRIDVSDQRVCEDCAPLPVLD